jgi:GTP-binding protein
MEWLGTSGIPFSMVFTKLDKLKKSEVEPKMKAYANKMLESWEELPVHFLSSAETAVGRKELLEYIDGLNISLKEKFRK